MVLLMLNLERLRLFDLKAFEVVVNQVRPGSLQCGLHGDTT